MFIIVVVLYFVFYRQIKKKMCSKVLYYGSLPNNFTCQVPLRLLLLCVNIIWLLYEVVVVVCRRVVSSSIILFVFLSRRRKINEEANCSLVWTRTL